MKSFNLFLVLVLPLCVQAQKYISEKSTVTFFSKATIEDIAARNEKAMGMLDLSSGDIAFSVPIKDFIFEKALMQEHFNEKYMESDKYPKGSFQGKLTGYSADAAGAQPARAQGKMSIHGVTKDIDISGTFEKKDDRYVLAAKFIITLEDYKVKRPQILWSNIAESVEVTIEFTLKPYEK